jgi:HK97 family phage portal protein
MDLFGWTIARTKALSRGISTILGGRLWWPLHDPYPGAWQQNAEVSPTTVLSNPTLYACVTLIAGDIAKLRPMLVEEDDHGIWSETYIPAFSPVLDTPNPYQDRVDFFEWWMLSKLCHGNTYALKARDARGVVQALFILDPYRVIPMVSTDGAVFYNLAPDPLNEVLEPVMVPAREMIHDVMCPLFHPLIGVSPIYAAGFPALQGLNIRTNSDKFFTNGSKPGGVLTAPGQISADVAKRLKDYWDANFSGDNIGKIAVLGDGLKYEPMALTAEQSQLVEQLRMTDEDIAKCFHMPHHKIGVGPDPTHNNVALLNQQYYADCLQKHIVKLQRKLTTGLGLDNVPAKTLAVEFDLDDLELMDAAARIDAGVKAITAGMSPNEARFRFYDLGPVPGGEQPYLQRQNWPLSLLGSDQPNPGATPPPAPPEPDDTPTTTGNMAPPDAFKALDVGRLLPIVMKRLDVWPTNA